MDAALLRRVASSEGLCVVLAGVASSDTPGSSSLATGRSGPVDAWDHPGRPVKVTMTPNPAQVASSTIGPAGGKLELKLPGGTTASLVISRGALLDPTRIVMTAATISGWTFGPPDRAAV